MSSPDLSSKPPVGDDVSKSNLSVDLLLLMI